MPCPWALDPDIEERVAADPRPAVVVPTDPGSALVKQALDSTGRTYTATPAGRFTVFTGITPPWRPGQNAFIFIPA